MDRGAPRLLITVVPDSGTSALEGLAGRMAIEIVEGRHFYIFDFSLPGSWEVQPLALCASNQASAAFSAVNLASSGCFVRSALPVSNKRPR